MKNIMPLAFVSTLAITSLSACGFQLRGYHQSDSLQAVRNLTTTQLIFGQALEDIAVKNALKHQFSQLAIKTTDSSASDNTNKKIDPNNNPSAINSIQVSNIRLQTYRLRGLLTEIRMVMSADVTYQIQQNGQPKIVTNNLQVQRSYQYDQASVATDNPQAEQIKVWLYDNLAQRIADQYMALIIPNTVTAATS